MEILSQMAELTSLCSMKKHWGELPVPNYIFVNRFGRHPVEFINQFKELTDKEVYFVFHENNDADKMYVRTLSTAMEVRAKLGKPYDGIVIVKLDSFDVQDSATKKLFEFIEKKKEEIYFIFELEDESEYEDWQNLLKKYFYTRKLSPENFSLEEQLEIVKKQLARVNFVMEAQAGEKLYQWISERNWDEGDYVQKEIEGIIKDLVYESVIRGLQGEINKEVLDSVLVNKEKKKENNRPIGFVLS